MIPYSKASVLSNVACFDFIFLLLSEFDSNLMLTGYTIHVIRRVPRKRSRSMRKSVTCQPIRLLVVLHSYRVPMKPSLSISVQCTKMSVATGVTPTNG